MKTRLFVALPTLLSALAVFPLQPYAQTVEHGSSATHGVAQASAVKPAVAQSSKVKTVPVQQLSNRVEKLIRIVEGSTLSCETRNGVVRRLRQLDDALRSGRRSAARAMVQAWRQHAWSMEAARVIGPEIGSSLQNQLGGMVDEIGYGWSDKPGPTRHWKPLPGCISDATGLVSASGDVVGSYDPAITDPSTSMKIFLQMILGSVPTVGPALSGVVELLWPRGSSADSNGFKELVDQNTYDLVSGQLEGLMKLMTDPATGNGWEDHLGKWKERCDSPPPDDPNICVNEANDDMLRYFGDTKTAFSIDVSMFQMSGHQVALLPLYAQYENLYLAFLRDGMMLHDEYWSKAGKDLDNEARSAMLAELDPTNTDRGIGYVYSVYNAGLNQKSGWADRNAYIRDNILKVLDFRDTWKYLNPDAYPNGVPGGVKLTRMIYSDPVGTIQATPHFPSNVSGPLKETSAWTIRIKPTNVSSGDLWIDAVQATSPPLLGPAQSGAITGDTSQPENHAHYYNLSALGPINKVEAERLDRYLQTGTRDNYPRWIRFDFATGAQYSAGDLKSEGACQSTQDGNCIATFEYPDEVLATVQAANEYEGHTDSVVFGFRYANSFDPSGELIGVYSGWCLEAASWTDGTQVELHPCYQPLPAAEIWTYDPNLQQISVTNPSEWKESNPTGSGKHCLDTADGGTAPYTHVVVNACDDGAYSNTAGVSSQRWTVEAVGAGIGRITNVKSGLVLDAYVSGGVLLLRLNSYNSVPWQQWHVHDPLTGEIHGIGSGRCVDVPNASIAPGTQVQIYDCNGTGAQQWTYNPTTQELIYAKAPTLCLEARGGGMSAGTAVQINTCTDNPEQQWELQGISEAPEGAGGGLLSGLVTNVKSRLVLGASDGNTGNGTLLHLSLYNSTEAEWWSRTSSQGGALYAVGAGKCLDVPSWGSVVVYTCANPLSATQTWVYHPVAQTFTVNSPSGPKCLEASGTTVAINDCTGAASQQWSRDFGNSTITNVASGLVLDVSGGGTADGTPVVMGTTSSPVSTNQQWVWSQH
jgi:hypothetical protein